MLKKSERRFRRRLNLEKFNFSSVLQFLVFHQHQTGAYYASMVSKFYIEDEKCEEKLDLFVNGSQSTPTSLRPIPIAFYLLLMRGLSLFFRSSDFWFRIYSPPTQPSSHPAFDLKFFTPICRTGLFSSRPTQFNLPIIGRDYTQTNALNEFSSKPSKL